MPDIKPNSAQEIENMYAAEEPTTPAPGASLAPPKKSKGPKVFLTLVLIIIIVLVALLVISKVTNWNILGLSKNASVAGIQDVQNAKASEWQAVFLSNGQVYFGKLKNINNAYPVLEDIYYLQVQNVPIQPAEPAVEEGGVQSAVETQEQIILVKFGTELHRPMDKMYINKDHILLFEDLTQDSNVVTAIENYKESL